MEVVAVLESLLSAPTSCYPKKIILSLLEAAALAASLAQIRAGAALAEIQRLSA
jgi:hypothetical protein